ncbi:phage tail protein I [Zooshikella marina]|uniref:phage tail protein I n=1 Tax=Zooshikella ganghwensis TaxID=202772 RepID=UPI001BAF1835|nr:phage tail protein I [Zooshikella ganghwensis]MBU2707549.1 phage tail protein I [Zooshikella ganghwensis]
MEEMMHIQSPIKNYIIEFSNFSTIANEFHGSVTIRKIQDQNDNLGIISYHLYWGDKNKDIIKLSNNKSIQCFYPDFDGKFIKPLKVESTENKYLKSIPENAFYLLVFVKRSKQRYKKLYAYRDLYSQNHLLPSNATALEKSISSTAARLSRIPLPINQFWDYASCPANVLPWLASSLSVDHWIDWLHKENYEMERRNIIAMSYIQHRYRGTRYGIEEIMKILGFNINISEWWEENYTGASKEPHHFDVTLLVNDNPKLEFNLNLSQLIETIIDQLKPLRSRCDIHFAAAKQAVLKFGCTAQVKNYAHFYMSATIEHPANSNM